MANVQPINPLVDQNQDYLLAQMKAQRAQQLADMLTQEGTQPIQYDQRGAISPLQGLAKLLQAYSGGSMANSAMQQSAAARSMGAALMAKAYGLDNGQSTVQQDSSMPMDATAAVGAGGGQQRPAPQPSPRPGGTSPLNPYGAPPALLMMAAQGDPAAKAQLDTFLKGVELTPEQKNSRDSLIGASTLENLATQNMTPLQKMARALQNSAPGSIMANTMQGGIKHENYIAPAEVKQGNVALNSDNQPIFYNPKTADGVVPRFQTNGGFTGPVSAGALPGYAGANAGIEGAAQGAREANSIKTVTLPDGSSYTDFGGRVAGTRGQSTTDAQIDKSAADVISNAPQIVTQSRQAVTGLENALQILDKVGQSGPGSEKKFNLLGMMNTAGIPVMKDDVNGYQSMQKYLANSLNTAAQGTGASGSDARFESFLHGQPNAENMSPEALKGAIRYVLSQHDAAIARAQVLPQAYGVAKQQNSPNAALNAQQAWANTYNPKVFEFSRMTPTERQQFKSNMSPEQQQKFGQQYNFAHQQGWVQ